MDLTYKQIFFYTSYHKLIGTYNYCCMKAKYQLEETKNKFVLFLAMFMRPPKRIHWTLESLLNSR
jgi:hypothetical protein